MTSQKETSQKERLCLECGEPADVCLVCANRAADHRAGDAPQLAERLLKASRERGELRTALENCDARIESWLLGCAEKESAAGGTVAAMTLRAYARAIGRGDWRKM